MREIDTFTLALLGAAAVGGFMGGTCLAIKKTLRNGQARLALLLGYAMIGLAFGVVGVALGVFIPVLDVQTVRGALVIGAGFGATGVLLLAAANIGSIITFRYFGLRVTIEPENPSHDRRRRDR